MTTKIAINGFGRIGRAAFKIAAEKKDVEIVAINDLTDTKTLAHLLKYDTNYGRYEKEVSFDSSDLIVEGKNIPVFAEKDPAKLPWGKIGVDVVLECTGFFTTTEKAKAHLDAGAKRVVVSAPTESADMDTILFGVNEDKLSDQKIISNGSCTTNCITPIAAIVEENFGIEKAMMTTVHAMTATQNLTDSPCKDLRRGRAAGYNIVPTSTGAAKASIQALPSLAGRFDGLSMRIPIPVVSLADFSIVTKKDVTKEEINSVFKNAAQSPLYKGIVEVTDKPAVSSDFIGDPHSAIVDLELTNVVAGNLIKIVAWYDNEWGYSNRLVEQAIMLGSKG
jgi:glyceraldehyde 3-phosphate dehydrogenase